MFWYAITLGALVCLSIYSDDKLDNKNGIYAQPLTVMFSAKSKEPKIAPHKDVCSNNIFMINSVCEL